jgi:hypothetical protein
MGDMLVVGNSTIYGLTSIAVRAGEAIHGPEKDGATEMADILDGFVLRIFILSSFLSGQLGSVGDLSGAFEPNQHTLRRVLADAYQASTGRSAAKNASNFLHFLMEKAVLLRGVAANTSDSSSPLPEKYQKELHDFLGEIATRAVGLVSGPPDLDDDY